MRFEGKFLWVLVLFCLLVVCLAAALWFAVKSYQDEGRSSAYGNTPGVTAPLAAVEAAGNSSEIARPPAGPVEAPTARAARSSDSRIADLDRIRKRLGTLDRSRAVSGKFVVTSELKGVDERTLAFFTEALKEIRPLLRDCYRGAMQADPELVGYARVNVGLVADDEYGALVESSDVVGDERIAGSATLTECLRETLYELRFPPRQVRGRMQVGLALVFASGGETGPRVPEVPEEARQMTFTLEDWLVGEPDE
ncbi:MAG TPA: hypothetical protein PK668_26755 [Myxococcota bacterium]|nr:hypothetical protein [Myxococcota bacterium]HRY97130.1 hypothetical protein [Myxococcota bacterium]HSA21207.1 hypothetical protein [Myxococcota bacterium]